MNRERLYLFDTTLRDGAQTNGVDFTLHDKQLIAQMLDELGIDYVEGGYPGANPTDTEFFATEAETRSRPLHGVRHDPACRAVRPRTIRVWRRCWKPRPTRSVLSRKSSAYQVRVALETTNEENLASIRDSVKAANVARAAKSCSTASISSTATRKIRQFALACAKAAYDSGARWVVLCDTNGGTMPHEIETIVDRGGKTYPRRSRRHPRP